MKRQPSNWPAIAIVVLSVFCSFAVGAFLATKWVSPCVCVIATPPRIQ